MNLSNDIVHTQIVSAPPGNVYSNVVNSCMKNFMTQQSSFGQNMSGGGKINYKKQKKLVFDILKILTKSYSRNKKLNIRQVINKKTKKKSK
jgi:hypothetical protein